MQIKKTNFSDENFSVSVSKSANEVVATYTKDEIGMDLVIRLPASYPLRPVDVDCMRSLGISEVKQRKWLMSMISFVRNQVILTWMWQILIGQYHEASKAEVVRLWIYNVYRAYHFKHPKWTHMDSSTTL